jgi:hypothetical protein
MNSFSFPLRGTTDYIMLGSEQSASTYFTTEDVVVEVTLKTFIREMFWSNLGSETDHSE